MLDKQTSDIGLCIRCECAWYTLEVRGWGVVYDGVPVEMDVKGEWCTGGSRLFSVWDGHVRLAHLRMLYSGHQYARGSETANRTRFAGCSSAGEAS